MGDRVWYFVKCGDGEFAKLPAALYWRFTQRKERLEACPAGDVLVARVSVAHEERRPTRVTDVAFSLHRRDSHGLIDWRHEVEAWRASSEVLAAHTTPSRHRGNVIDIRPHTAARELQREHRWRPSGCDLDALCSLVNGRAERPLIRRLGDRLHIIR